MKSLVYLWGLTIICALLGVVLLWKVLSLDRQVRTLQRSNSASLQESFKRMQAELAAAIHLHAGKLWFAARAANWELAAYELHEIEEMMEIVMKLNVEKNGVKISNVMDAVLKTQVAQLERSIKAKNYSDFQKSYDET